MVEDKYIGLAIAIAGNVGIGSSFIFTKKVRRQPHASVLYLPQFIDHGPGVGVEQGLIAASKNGASATNEHTYFRSPLWWIGMVVSE